MRSALRDHHYVHNMDSRFSLKITREKNDQLYSGAQSTADGGEKDGERGRGARTVPALGHDLPKLSESSRLPQSSGQFLFGLTLSFNIILLFVGIVRFLYLTSLVNDNLSYSV